MAEQAVTFEDQGTAADEWRREERLLKSFDSNLSLVRHECQDGSVLWRVMASFDDGRPDEIACSQPKLAGIAAAYRKHLKDAKRKGRQRAKLVAEAARRCVPVEVLEREAAERRRQDELR